MTFGDGRHQTETQPVPGLATVLFQPVETPQHLIILRSRDARASIGHTHPYFGRIHRHAKRYDASGRGIFDGVVEQIGQRLEQQIAVALQRCMLIQLQR
jgi:hypothetical protein